MDRGRLIQHVVNFIITEYSSGVQMYGTLSQDWNVNPESFKMVASFHTDDSPVVIFYNIDCKYVDIVGLTKQEFNMVKLIADYRVKIINTGEEE